MIVYDHHLPTNNPDPFYVMAGEGDERIPREIKFWFENHCYVEGWYMDDETSWVFAPDANGCNLITYSPSGEDIMTHQEWINWWSMKNVDDQLMRYAQ